MAHNAKSIAIASQLNDLFARLSLHGVRAWPTDNAENVLVQYRSEKLGCTRTVSCEARPLIYWLNERALQPGCRPRFEAILDRKPEWRGAAQQQELNLGEASPIAKRSMRYAD